MTQLACQTVSYGSPAYHETIALRDAILRQPLGLRFTPAQLAAENDDIHLTIWADKELVGCLVLTPKDESTLKMRQVAIQPAFQGQGIGQQLVRASEALARERGFAVMMCHARETAVPFYEKLGYTKKGAVFMEVTLPHYYMEKAL